jgi:hypothetical protein
MNSNSEMFLRSLLDADMVDEWDGDQESPVGYFGHVTIANIEEAVELHEALYGCAPTLSEREDMARPAAMKQPGVVGNFVVMVNSDGIISVTRFSTIKEKLEAYSTLMDAYMQWAEAV